MKKLVALLLTVVMMSMFTAVGFADSEENGNQITVNGKALTSEEKIQYDITFDNGEINNLEIEKNAQIAITS